MEKYQIKIDDTTVNVDHLSFEYSQLDSEATTRAENGSLTRDVIGMTNKIYCGFDYKQGTELSTLLKLVDLTSATVTYIDPKEGQVTKSMYIVCDNIEILLIDGEYVAQPFEMRLIQLDVDPL